MIKTEMLIFALILVTVQFFLFSDGIGVNYGRLGDNLPPPADVVNLYKRCGIGAMRTFDPSPEVLEALRGSNIPLSLGVRNEDLQSLAQSPDAATAWVKTNVVPYQGDVIFDYITLGNEVIPGPFAAYVTPAMQNIRNAVNSIGLTGTKVTTVTAFILASSFPPSAGAFSEDAIDIMKEVTTFLSQTNAPILANVYPYFAYAANPVDISFAYAAFQLFTPVVTDGQYAYNNLFDAMVDAYYVALEKIGAGNIPLVVSETGWPSAGNGNITTPKTAQIYIHNLDNHVKRQGTPRKPAYIIPTFIFSLFKENQKPVGIEQNWGLYYPNLDPVYPFFACGA